MLQACNAFQQANRLEVPWNDRHWLGEKLDTDVVHQTSLSAEAQTSKYGAPSM